MLPPAQDGGFPGPAGKLAVVLFNPALIEVGLANVRVCVDSVKKTVLRIVFIPVLGTELEQLEDVARG